MAPASYNENLNSVCVMDASGHIGASLVQGLPQRGYVVHAAVQNCHGDMLSFSNGVSNYDDKRLKIFQSDPFDYPTIVEALKGCSGLFYTFEPPQDHPNYDEYMAEVEVKAAHNVLEACAQTDTIDKVVFTSSANAVVWTDDRNSTSTNLDERHWTDVNFCRKYKLWHALSKTLAEKSAWSLAMDRGVNLVCMNAGLLMANELSITNPYLKGAVEVYEDGVLVTVDMEFLVDAHIFVFEDLSTYGRYLCFNHVINCNEGAIKLGILLCPANSSQPQRYQEDTSARMIEPKISNKKLDELMVGSEGGPRLID